LLLVVAGIADEASYRERCSTGLDLREQQVPEGAASASKRVRRLRVLALPAGTFYATRDGVLPEMRHGMCPSLKHCHFIRGGVLQAKPAVLLDAESAIDSTVLAMELPHLRIFVHCVGLSLT
jgi:hypothetical protein